MGQFTFVAISFDGAFSKGKLHHFEISVTLRIFCTLIDPIAEKSIGALL
jgi:hypothetical protein